MIRIKLPPIYLPEELTSMLVRSSYLRDKSGDVLNEIFGAGSKNRHLVALIEKIIDQREKKENFKFIGQRNARNWLSAIYMHYFKYNEYPESIDLSLINDLLELERKYQAYLPEDDSHLFLFFFYLKVVEINHQNEHPKEWARKIDNFPHQLFLSNANIFKLPIKLYYLDWLMLILWHFADYWGPFKFKEMILKENEKEKSAPLPNLMQKYFAFFNQLPSDAQATMATNLLSYGYSTHNLKIFTELLSDQW